MAITFSSSVSSLAAGWDHAVVVLVVGYGAGAMVSAAGGHRQQGIVPGLRSCLQHQLVDHFGRCRLVLNRRITVSHAACM